MDLTELEKIGLKEKEAKVYIALLKKGSSLANQLAKETNILRSSIYDYLDVLLDKGFITYTIKSGKKYFQSVEPEKILDQFHEQRTQQESALKAIIPHLNKLKGTEKKKINVEVFEGKEGLKSAFSAVLRTNPEELLAHGSSGVSYKILPFFMEHWHKQREKQKIKVKAIYNDVPQARERVMHGPRIKTGEIRFLPKTGASLTSIMIYKDYVLYSIWDPENPVAIQIQGESINKIHREEFEILWKQAKP
ncbi:MAG: helix-turn-helix domain-containing protein [archaeon]